jgi:RHS repeat-associated protein
VLWRAPGQNLLLTTACNDASVTAAGKISYTYDKRNRLLTTGYGDLSAGDTRTYWPDGKPKTITSNGANWSYEYNKRRLLSKETLGFGGVNYVFNRGYNANGDASSLSYPTTASGSPSLVYSPNALGEPTQVGSYASSIQFHPSGALAGFSYGNGVAHTQSQNTRQLPERLQDGTLLKDLYAYDKNGNVEKITDEQLAQFTRTMTYDGLDRLKTANAPNVWGNASYSYDAVDNLTVANVGSRTVSLAYDTKNRLSSATINGAAVPYGYDARGNISSKGPHSYGFDLGNRLTHVNQTNAYVYDGHGRRTRVMASDGSTRIQVYGLDGKLLWSTNTGGGRASSSTAYIHLGGKLIAEWSSDAAKGLQYLHTDALGSPVARTNSSGALIGTRTRYEAYGGIAAGTKPGPANSIVGYTGHVQDPETDLVYMQQRYYDPIAGRFLSVDPVVTDASTGKLFGRYHYAENNPYVVVDPDGRQSTRKFQKGDSLRSAPSPRVHPDPTSLVGKPAFLNSQRNNECVELVKQTVGDDQATDTLRQGEKVDSNTPPGTAVAARWKPDGSFPKKETGQHAGLLATPMQPNGSFTLVDQSIYIPKYAGNVGMRVVNPKPDALRSSPSNNAKEYYVILFGK